MLPGRFIAPGRKERRMNKKTALKMARIGVKTWLNAN
jgi:hypothetical protein